MSETKPKPSQDDARPKILLADDTPANLNILRRLLQDAGYAIQATTQSTEVAELAAKSQPALVLLDVMMPEMDGFEVCQRLKQNEATSDIPVIYITAMDEKDGLAQAFEAGGVDYIRKPFERDEVLIRVRTHLEIGRLNAELRRNNDKLVAANRALVEEVARREDAERAKQKADERLEAISRHEAERLAGFIGRSPSLQKILDEVRQLQSASSVNVLVNGESGTGKELIARALHFNSSRSKAPFVTLNCGAISAELAESTLFGHVKGAFTGATSDHKGCFEQADGGTLFLDEVGDMPMALQVKLLRVLENGALTPVGGTTERQVDVRVVAATNVDLAQGLAAGSFRQDLYFRLATCKVEVPPLRQRPEDVPLLATHFLLAAAADLGLEAPVLGPQVLAALRVYSFPGNVRELKNMMVQALVMSGGEPIQRQHLDFHEALDTEAAAAGEEDRILAYVQREQSIGNAECRQLLQVDARRAKYLLDKLQESGLLLSQGSGRWRRYGLAGQAPPAGHPQNN